MVSRYSTDAPQRSVRNGEICRW